MNEERKSTTPKARGMAKAPKKANTQGTTTSNHNEDEMYVTTSIHEANERGSVGDSDENNPEMWFGTTEENITTNGKGFRRTATLPGGWLKVYLVADPSFNITAENINDWEDIPEPTIWARLYRARYKHSEEGKMRAGDMIKAVVKNLVYIKHDKRVAVIFLNQDLPPNDGNRFLHPYHLLVAGLDHQQAQRLLDLEVVTSLEATVFFLPQNPPNNSIFSQ